MTQFSTGVMLFELTTGKRLFKGASEYETLSLICERNYPLPSEVCRGYPIDLERIVMKALAKNASDRYQSAREMQGDLESFVRRHQVAVSHIALDRFMMSLFEEKLALQKKALLQGKQLADIIDMEHAQNALAAGHEPYDVEASGRLSTGTSSVPAAARTLTGLTAASFRRSWGGRSLGLAAGALAVSAVGGGIGYLVVPKQSLMGELARTSPVSHGSPASGVELDVAPAPSASAARASVGTLHVDATGGRCSITVDGAGRGATPVDGARVATGPHLVTCTTADGKSQSAAVVVPADGAARYTFTL